MTTVRRVLIALVALAGLALAVTGAWLAVVLGPSGTATFGARATGPIVLGPQVLGRVDVPVIVRAVDADGPVFVGAATPQDVTDMLRGARVQQAVSARFPARTLTLRATGSGDLIDPRALEVWRQTGSGSLDLDVADAPESVVVVPTTNAPVRVTVELRRGAWFLEAVVALIVGLIIAAAALVWLVQQLGHRIPLGPLARRGRPERRRPPRVTNIPSRGIDEDDEDDELPASDRARDPASASASATDPAMDPAMATNTDGHTLEPVEAADTREVRP